VGGKFTLSESGNVSDISVYVEQTSVAKNMKCAIYHSSNSSLIVSTIERSISVGTKWESFTITGGQELNAGSYNLTTWSQEGFGTAFAYYNTSGGNGVVEDAENYNGYPNPANFVNVDNDGIMSIYCNYTVIPSISVPEIDINYIGTNGTGGPYWNPGNGTGETLKTVDGYITNNTQLYDDSLYINLSVYNASDV